MKGWRTSDLEGPNQLRRGDRYAGGVPRTIFLVKQMEKKSTANEQLALAA